MIMINLHSFLKSKIDFINDLYFWKCRPFCLYFAKSIESFTVLGFCCFVSYKQNFITKKIAIMTEIKANELTTSLFQFSILYIFNLLTYTL